ncbi:MAG: proton-conducting transporter membrane subunit [Propionibacteriaceae bacterium]
MTLAAFVLFGVAIAVGWFAGRPPDVATARPLSMAASKVSWSCSLAAAVCLVVAGGRGLGGHDQRLPVDVMGGLGDAALRVDALTGLFLVIGFGTAVPVLLAGLAGVRAGRPRLPAAVGFTLAAMALIMLADNLYLLLAGWESLGFAFYFVVGYDRTLSGRPRSAVLAASFSKVSGAALLVGGLVLAGRAHSLTLAELGGHPAGSATAVAYALLVAGFAVKVGLVPAHIWLPPSYTAAPGPARAVLAGVAVNVGFYGLWRTLDVLGAPPVWLAGTVLVVAGLSAILGISHAAVHADLTGLVAWSSVENAGLIVVGLGVSMVGAIMNSPQLTAAGLLAGTAQICTHAAAKSLLFVSTSAIEEATGTVDLDRLRGVTRRMPFSGAGLVVGGLTLAGLPLTAGFASEWFLLEALMQQFRVQPLGLQLCLAVAGVLCALTVGVAGIAFVRLVALTAYGHPAVELDRHAPDRTGAEWSWLHRAAVAMLIVACLGLSAAAPLEVTAIAHGLTPLVGRATFAAIAEPLILQPVFARFSALSPSLLWLVLPGYMLLIVVLASALSGRRFFRVRREPAWTSGSRGVPAGNGYTSYAFANPIRQVLATVLMTRRELREVQLTYDTDTDHAAQAGVATAASREPVAQLGYTVDVTDVVERYLFTPLLPVLFTIVRTARKLQSGRLDAYMAYMLIALLAVISVVSILTTA